MYDKMRLAFSRLPIDLASSSINVNANSTAALRHLRTVIEEYCNILEKRDENDGSSGNNGNDDYDNNNYLPPISMVADWALVSFSAVVVSNGFEDLNVESEQYQTETKIVAVLQSLQSSTSASPLSSSHPSSSCTRFSIAMIDRIKELMEPFALERASNLNFLCLVRYLSYLPVSLVENIVVHSIDESFRGSNCGSSMTTGLSHLPKILASYVSVASRNYRKRGGFQFQYEAFEMNVRQKLRQNHEIGRQQEVLSFFHLIFQTMKYLIKEKPTVDVRLKLNLNCGL